MKVLRQFFFFVLFLFPLLWGGTEAVAQRGKDGVKIVATANNIVNEYTTLAANAVSGTTTITVANSTLNANGRFPGALASGDLIMIIQIQGATILGVPPFPGNPSWGTWSEPRDSTWGAITNYNDCGNWEFAEVTSVPSGTSITLDCPLTNNYTSSGRVVVVRVPRYSSLTINAGGSITCDPWNGSVVVGGVCAIEVQNNTTINGGSIDVTGKGFRSELLEDSTDFGVGEAASLLARYGAEKGESIAGYAIDYDVFGGRYCKGAPANGGGGGNAHNCGGGGGANGGNPLLWNGHGIPDNTGLNWNLAWNKQYAGFSTQTSTGGGQGGYSFSNSNQNAINTGPNNAAWSGDSRTSMGGFGGRPLDYSTGRLFLGGGGGSGDQNDGVGGKGGYGGALIYLMNYGTVSGTGQINSNGNNGANTTGIGTDGAGGGGAGGTIVVNSVGIISGVSITANGGKGGNQVKSNTLSNEAEGPGGGGSGGYIAISNGTPTRTINGGANGTTNSFALTEFIPNGATQGDAGTNNATVTNFIINAPNVTICAGQAATLSATLSGTVPGGTTIVWYNAIVAGNVLGTGSVYTTTVVPTGTYTYYVGTCPSTYHQPVIVTATSSIPPTITGNTTICNGASSTLTASGGTNYVWSTTATTTSIIISPTTTTNYSVTSTGVCGGTATVTVTVSSSIPPTITGNTTICNGASSTLTASGGTNYVWSTTATTTSIIISPTATTNYSVTSTGVCGGTATVTVNVNPGITALITGNITICGGSSTTLTASGGSNYSWNNGLTTSYISITPTATTTYSVIVSGGNCSDTASVTMNVSASPTVAITGNTTICGGNSTTLIASGGGNYLWTTGATSASVIVSPTSTTNYFVTASNGNCSSTASVTVTISNGITAAISGNTNLCKGEVATLTASGGGTYLWSSGQTTAVINPSTAGSYSVLVTAGSCSAAATAVVTVNPIPAVTVSPNIIITQGQNTNLSASGGTNYVWNNGMNGGNITVSPSGTTVYCVTVYDANTCHDTACVTVIVELCSTAGTLYLPNAFSPNGDGANDSLQIYYGIPQCIKDFRIVIYNRWGESVYETYDPAFKWGGVYNKALLQDAGESDTEVFTYYMDVAIMDGTHISRKGNISLIR